MLFASRKEEFETGARPYANDYHEKSFYYNGASAGIETNWLKSTFNQILRRN
jgi:hypothetical protein